MTHKPAHKPAGTPEGGQFAATHHAEPGLSLATGAQIDGGAHAAPAGDLEEAKEYAVGQISHHISPVIGWIRRDGAAGKDTAPHLQAFRDGVNRAAEDIARRLGPSSPPVLDGFTAAEVEDYLAREQHDRQCGCHLPDGVCCTPSYGEHWRHRMGVPDVEGIFETIQEMAEERNG